MVGALNSNESSSHELLKAHAHLWNMIYNFINSMSLKCAIDLNIPDIIHDHGNPITLSELTQSLKINSSKVPYMYRLMRILTHSGIFVKSKIGGNEKTQEEDAYTLTPFSNLLLKNHPLSMNPLLSATLQSIWIAPWLNLSDWFRNDEDLIIRSPFASTHGRDIWEMAGQEQGHNNLFNEAMASDARLVSSLVVENSEELFGGGLNSLVDVGGGTGTMAKAIADSFPGLKCTVLDLPHVVRGLEGTKNVAYVGGDMFKSIPPADAVLLKSILHDWPDEESIEILKKCKESIPSKERGGKVIVIDMVLGDQTEDKEATETQLFSDMLMMVLAKGRERNEKEWAELFFQAGFSEYKIIPMLGLRSVIEVYYS
ncbi:hypothetical protein M9H77_33961 [Catharanthus roseus]|uniref:Uncharacterized protein n=1 Tax=Catharanthus roseus TaxID=4058 RepID=A0ACB9ZL11_CATRO|nr:hypothetical protein M9H77_33961 [Catharanthus roseus]